MEPNHFNLIALVFGILIIVGVKSNPPEAITVPTAQDLAEGIAYERFTFLNEFMLDGTHVDDELHWKKCSNYTGIDAYLNVTNSQDCLGTVINCTNPNVPKPATGFWSIFRFRTITIDNINGRNNFENKCLCLCKSVHDPKPLTGKPNLLDSVCLDTVSADVENNYAITGVRLARLNNTLTFQIEQAKIIDGMFDPEFAIWKPLPKKCNKIGLMDLSHRTLVLDDIYLEENWVVTGVTFERYEGMSGSPFYLSLFGQPLGEDSNLNINRNKKFSNWDFTLSNRINMINDNNLDIPPASQEPQNVLSVSGKNYVTFELSLANLGVRETLVPYIDIQKVGDYQYRNLRGIGIFYRGYEDFAGYIAIKIFV